MVNHDTNDDNNIFFITADSNEDNEPNEPETKHLIEQDLLDCGATPNNIEGITSFHWSFFSVLNLPDVSYLRGIIPRKSYFRSRRIAGYYKQTADG